LVAEHDCKVEWNNEQFTATPSNYPAFIVGNKLTLKKNTVSITGLIYCEGDLVIDKNATTIIGAIICLKSIKNVKNETTITYDPAYVTDIVGMSEVNYVEKHSWQEF
jgi:hypothetical protein